MSKKAKIRYCTKKVNTHQTICVQSDDKQTKNQSHVKFGLVNGQSLHFTESGLFTCMFTLMLCYESETMTIILCMYATLNKIKQEI